MCVCVHAQLTLLNIYSNSMCYLASTSPNRLNTSSLHHVEVIRVLQGTLDPGVPVDPSGHKPSAANTPADRAHPLSVGMCVSFTSSSVLCARGWRVWVGADGHLCNKGCDGCYLKYIELKVHEMGEG